MHPKLRKVFYGLEDPEEIVVLWKQFKKEKPQSTFTEFVLNSTKQLNKGTAELRRGFADADKWMTKLKNFHAHHVIPKKIAKEYADFFEKINFTKYIEDGNVNGIMIPPNKTTLDNSVNKALRDGDSDLAKQIKAEFENSAFHEGRHDYYTEQIRNQIRYLEKNLERKYGKIAEITDLPLDAQQYYLQEVFDIIEIAKEAIKNGGNQSINIINIKFK